MVFNHFIINIRVVIKVSNYKYLTETIKLMQNHRSIRRYTIDPIPKEHILEIVKAAQGAASSNFVQAYSVVMIDDQNKKEKIAELANNQAHVTECPVLFIFCADMKRLEVACQKNGVSIEYDTLENFMVSLIDTALFAENFLTAAESLGYGGCYIGGIRNNPESVSEIINLPDKVIPLFGLTLGVPLEEQEVKPRLPIEAVLHENSYSITKYSSLLDQYDITFRKYYETRTKNAKHMTWTKTMATFLSDKKRTHMKEFILDKGFHLE